MNHQINIYYSNYLNKNKNLKNLVFETIVRKIKAKNEEN